MTKATVRTLDGDMQRLSLPAPHYSAVARGQSEFTGVWITGLYSSPRTGRRFARTESIWDDGRGRCVGEAFHELDESEYLHYCRLVYTEPMHVEAAEA